jgi:hypothetical protein
MPQLQGKPLGETKRAEVPGVRDDPGATRQRRQEAETLTARHRLCHPKGSKPEVGCYVKIHTGRLGV